MDTRKLVTCNNLFNIDAIRNVKEKLNMLSGIYINK